MRKFIFFIALAWGVVQTSAQPSTLDYSYCGYRMSESTLPNVPVVAIVAPSQGDQAAVIQQAIDYVSGLKPDKNTGFRGAVLLEKGTYNIQRPIYIRASGVVLRGADKTSTIIRKCGVERGAAIYIEGIDNRQRLDTLSITAETIALNSLEVPVSGHISKGDELVVWRPSTKEWIASMQCDNYGGGKDLGYWGWHPGEIDVEWTRRAVSVSGQTVTIDAPLSMTLDAKASGAKIIRQFWTGRIENAGVENLTIDSEYDTGNPADEDHCWDGINIMNARDCWVRIVDFQHLSGSAVIIQRSGEQITIEDCISRQPIGECGGLRRRTFFVLGEKVLVQRCYSEHGVNDFSAGICAAGPNAFVQCDSHESNSFSGSIGPWATGLLFDNVNIDGNDIRFQNLGIEKYGTGWNTANSLLWQSTAAGIFCYDPDSIQKNYVYGCWAQFEGNSYFDESNNHVKPRSIFAHLLSKRLGHDVAAQCRVLERNTEASSSPSIEEAKRFTTEARQPRVTMENWIKEAILPADLLSQGTKLPKFTQYTKHIDNCKNISSPELINGHLTLDGSLMVGGKHQTPWWNGRVRYPAIARATYALTRFIPGMEGKGATDRIDSVIVEMKRDNSLVFSQNYGLWYDRRRDDHERIRRRDGDVWAPFYEQPFARSGESKAWDGLSKYDLTKLNKWYYARLHEYARKAAPEGKLLWIEHYFQHNILEAGAHWVDCPWRTANNINHTDFPEPVPFTGDKRIFMAEYFYDVNHPVRRELHKQYIMQTLDALKDQPNVIHSIGEEFTGPLHFVQFWLDVIAEWEQANGQNVLVALAVNKDVQDAILADPARSKVVDIIGIVQWYYHQKGLYAPDGGVNMAPRQYARKIKAGGVRFEDVYRSVREYRDAFPEKAVVYYAKSFPEMAWAALMAGASCPAVRINNAQLLTDLPMMHPTKPTNADAGVYVLQNDQVGALLYADGVEKQVTLQLPSGAYRLFAVDRKSGVVTPQKGTININGTYTMTVSGIQWLQKIK